MHERHRRILGVLARGDTPKGMHLRDITKAIRTSHGPLYPALLYLENQGYIESRWQDKASWPNSKRPVPSEPVGTPHRTRYYRITQNGLRARVNAVAGTVQPGHWRLGKSRISSHTP